MSETDTPITDALVMDMVRREFSAPAKLSKLVAHARKQERELTQQRARAERAEEQVSNLKETHKRDGNWIDRWGACKVCDGEIPYGHTDNCDLYKLEKENAELRAKLTA